MVNISFNIIWVCKFNLGVEVGIVYIDLFFMCMNDIIYILNFGFKDIICVWVCD